MEPVWRKPRRFDCIGKEISFYRKSIANIADHPSNTLMLKTPFKNALNIKELRVTLLNHTEPSVLSTG